MTLVTLSFVAACGSTGNPAPEKIDLLVVVQGGDLQADDIYCTGADPETTDAFAPGWLNRSVCSS